MTTADGPSLVAKEGREDLERKSFVLNFSSSSDLMSKLPRVNNYSTPPPPSLQSTPTLFEQLRFFAPSSVTEREREKEANESDIKETSIMRGGGGGYYKAAHKQREREKRTSSRVRLFHYR